MRHLLLAPVLAALGLAPAACAGNKAGATSTPTSTPTPTPTSTSTAAPTATATAIIPVAGMTCGGCVRHVTNTLQAMDGVVSAEVSLAEKRAVVRYEPARVQPAAMAAAIREAGYEPGQPVVTN